MIELELKLEKLFKMFFWEIERWKIVNKNLRDIKYGRRSFNMFFIGVLKKERDSVRICIIKG